MSYSLTSNVLLVCVGQAGGGADKAVRGPGIDEADYAAEEGGWEEGEEEEEEKGGEPPGGEEGGQLLTPLCLGHPLHHWEQQEHV